MNPAVELSIVIVTWNCRDLALRCLATIGACVAGVAHEILVVDNASTDGTPHAVAAAFPAVTMIVNSTNAGFAAANNRAMALASGRFWLLLNPDAFPRASYDVAGLLAFMAENPRIGAAGPRLLHVDGRHQVGDAGFAPSPASIAIHAFSLMRLSPRLHGLFLTRVASQAPMDVDWLCGACLMIRAEAARAAGFLDERFFLYGEDIEWGCRLRDHGWRVVYLPAMHTLHLGGGTQGGLGQNPALGLSFSTRWLDGLAQVYRRRNPRRGLAMLRIFIALGYGGRALVYAAMSLWPSRRIALRGRARAMAIYARYGLRLRAR